MDGKPTFSGDPFLEPCLELITIPTYKVESENHTNLQSGRGHSEKSNAQDHSIISLLENSP